MNDYWVQNNCIDFKMAFQKNIYEKLCIVDFLCQKYSEGENRNAE